MRFIFEVEIVADKLIPPPPAVALGIADRPWSIGDLLDAALAIEPPAPTETVPDRRRGGSWPLLVTSSVVMGYNKERLPGYAL
jgi:hypothetical protein